MIARLADGASRRALGLLAAVFAVLAIAPFVVNDYLLTVMIVALYLAYTGQAWNIMMGFAGQLSLGNAIYAGLGAYVAAVLFTRYGVAPWLGLLAAIPVAAACAAIIGFLAFRFGVAGVYFAILTIAFAEFARVGFDHLEFVHASAGLFLPVTQYTHDDLWRLRGNPTMFYYVILAATAVAFLLSRALLKSRIGYFWLAIREDEQAARAAGIDTFRYKMYALMISAASDVVCRRVLRILLQQPVPRTGLQHHAVDRDDSRSDHRRRRHAVRAGAGRVCADRNGGVRDIDHGCARFRSSRRQAGVLRHLSAAGRGGAARGHLAAAGAAAWH